MACGEVAGGTGMSLGLWVSRGCAGVPLVADLPTSGLAKPWPAAAVSHDSPLTRS